jgi:hypothetical protein
MNYPNPPIQTSLEMQWHRRMNQAARANRIRTSRGLKVRRTPNGIFLQASGGGGRSELSLYRFKSMEDDWIVCRSWDGTNEGDKDIQIAKPYKLQFSIVTETIDDTVVTYSAWDTDAQTRHASSGDAPNTIEEDQVIVPRYLVDDLIYVFPAKTLIKDDNDKDLGLIDMNLDGRAWAATS